MWRDYDIVRSYVVPTTSVTDTVSHVIHVVDNSAPVFTNVPADAALDAAIPPDEPAVAVDNCNGVTITYGRDDGTGCGGRPRADLVCQDACGNVNTATTYTIEDTRPDHRLPADVTLSCEDEYDFPTPTATMPADVDLTEEMRRRPALP